MSSMELKTHQRPSTDIQSRRNSVPLSEDLLLGVLVLALGAGFTVLGGFALPDWQRTGFWQSATFDDLIGATAIAAGIAIVLWWLVSMLAAVAAALLFARGNHRLAARFGRLAPGFMRRLAIALLGINLTTVPLAYAGQTTGPTAPAVQEAPGQESVEPAYRGVDPAWKPRTAAPPPAAALPPAATRAVRVVEAGESLWSIAATTLGAGAAASDIAAEWPRWYAQNRESVGPDPDRLLAGAELQVPDPA